MNKFRELIFLCIVLFCQNSLAQFKEEKIKLAAELKEISGLEIINDSILVAHNDSGNEPILYFISQKGVILHTCLITNANNVDWEDITKDDQGNLYIADSGNNLNKRKNLCIYKIKGDFALIRDSIEAELINFSYVDQVAFPPTKNNLEFDCEAMFWRADSLFLVTKSSSNPWKGITTIYGLTNAPMEQSAVPVEQLLIGESGWKKDAVTAADALEEKICVLTYNRMIFYNWNKGNLVIEYSYKFKKYNQKEAMVMASNDKIFVATEKHRFLGGPFLYIITKK